MTASPHLRLLYEDHIPPVVFNDFRQTVEADGFALSEDTRARSGPFLGLEWLMPTAVMLFITQGYFNGFLGEMGKDHYQTLKSGLKALCGRFAKVKVTPIGTPGKVSADQPYSLVFSLWSDGDDGRTFKFLIPAGDQDVIDIALDRYLDFIEAYAAGALAPSTLQALADVRRLGKIILLAYDVDEDALGVMDPVRRAFELHIRQ